VTQALDFGKRGSRIRMQLSGRVFLACVKPWVPLYPNRTKKKIKKKITWPSTVAHAYNPSYLGDRDQEDHSSKSDWTKSS
jgi:hypothetical protein